MTTPAPQPQFNRTPLVAGAGGVLLALTIFLAVRGGWLAVDIRTVSAENLPAVGEAVTARLIGVLYILLWCFPFLAAVGCAAAGWGWPLCRWLAPKVEDRWVIRGATGLVIMLLVDYLLALAGGLNSVGGWSVCAVGIALLLASHFFDAPKELSPPESSSQINLPWLAVGLAPPVGLLLVAACCPPGTLWSVEAFGYDVMSYHLQVPRQWLETGRMTGLHENVYSYLPSLVEVGFMQLDAMAGSAFQGIYLCQLACVAAALLAAAGVGALAARLSPPGSASTVRWVAAAVFLATPWTLITGSLAYDEMPMLALGSAAILLALDREERSCKAALLIGLLAGAATLAKLTAGFMIALPVGLLVLLNACCPRFTTLSIKGEDHSKGAARKDSSPFIPPSSALKRAALAALAGVITLTPYLLRNAAWTGNPVFPFAARTLGLAHWSEFDAARWDRGHKVEESVGQRFESLGEQWLTNRGYGGVAGRVRPARQGVEARNVAHFQLEDCLPTLAAASLIGLALLLCDPRRRGFALAMATVLAVQLACWMFVTHLQSRFLIAWLLPGVALAGAGLARLDELVRSGPRPSTWLGAALLATLIAVEAQTFASQTILAQIDNTAVGLPPWRIVNSLPPADMLDKIEPGQFIAGDHPINHLPPGSKTLLVADNARLIYIRQPIVYSSAFDTSPLGQLIREHPRDYVAVTAALKQMGITHVWVHLGELERLMATYGYDPDVTPDTLAKLKATGWTKVEDFSDGQVVLYRLP